MRVGGGDPRGRFTRLVAPTLLALSFLLGMALCERQERGMDGPLVSRVLADRLHAVFVTAATVSSLVAGAFALWLGFRGKGSADALAMGINAIAAVLVPPFALMVT